MQKLSTYFRIITAILFISLSLLTSACINPLWSLIVNSSGSGTVTENPNQPTYLNGSLVQLLATSDSGWSFTGWSGDVTGSANPVTITMNNNKSVTANFNNPNNNNVQPFAPSNPTPANGATNVPTFTLSWNGGDTDSGDTVTYDVYFGESSPPPILSSHLTETKVSQTFPIARGTHYYWKVIATDNHGAPTEGPVWEFTTAASSPAPLRYILSTSITPAGAGTVSPSSGGPYDAGTNIALTEIPVPGYRFDSWSGDAYGTSATTTINMSLLQKGR